MFYITVRPRLRIVKEINDREFCVDNPFQLSELRKCEFGGGNKSGRLSESYWTSKSLLSESGNPILVPVAVKAARKRTASAAWPLLRFGLETGGLGSRRFERPEGASPKGHNT